MSKPISQNKAHLQWVNRQSPEQTALSSRTDVSAVKKKGDKGVDELHDREASPPSMTHQVVADDTADVLLAAADPHEPDASDKGSDGVDSPALSKATPANAFALNDFIVGGAYEYGALEMASSSTLLMAGAGLVGVAALGAGSSASSSTLNHAPTLIDKAIYLPQKPTDNLAPVGKVGALVSMLTAGVHDVDEGDSKGIAITQIDEALGQVFFSLDNGNTWTPATGIGPTDALLLAANANTRIYIRPLGAPLGIVPHVAYFRAWDQTSGTNGSIGNVNQYGGNSAFSLEMDSISLNVVASLVGDYSENGAPVPAHPSLELPTPLASHFSAASVQIMGGFSVGDVLSFSNTAAITAVYDSAAGRLDIEGVATASEYEDFLRGVTFHSFVDDPLKWGAIRSLIWQIEDADGNFYVNQVNELRIIAENDAPILMPDAPMLSDAAFGAGLPTATSGELVSHFISSMMDPDGDNAKSGLVMIKMAPNLALHFSSNGGLSWNAVTDLSPTEALHLMKDSDNKIYFQMLPGFSGDIQASYSFRGWDQTAGVDGLMSTSLPAGGTSAYSLEIGGGLAPEFSGPTSINVTENTPAATVIYDASANGDFNVTYSLGGPDAALFSIDPAQGKIKFLSSPDYETPLDVGANNVYNIQIRATNPYGTFAEAPLAITVKNANESVVTPAGLDKNHLESNDSPGTWVTYSDALSVGFNVYASALGADVLSQIQISIDGGVSWKNMTRSGGYAVYHVDGPLTHGMKTYRFRSVDVDGLISAVTTQKIDVSAWTTDASVTLATAASLSINANETNSLYGSYNNPSTGPGQTFNLSQHTIDAFINNQSTPRWVHGGPTDTTDVGYFLTRQVDHLNLTGAAAVLNLSQLRGQEFSVNQIHGFEFINMQANSLSQGVVTDGISLGSFSTGRWLSNPELLSGHYVVVIRGGANDALVLSKGGNFDTHQFELVGTSAGELSAGHFFPDMGNFNIYRNAATKQYILLEQGVQLSRWTAGFNAAPVLIATHNKNVNIPSEFATSILAPTNGQAQGVLVSSLVGGVYDADGADVSNGIAITSVHGNGQLFYSTNAGVTWVQAASNISVSKALLLAADTDNRIYFQTNSPLSESVSDAITFKAWDKTSGLDGSYANTTSSGGSTAFSTASENAVFKVLDVPLSILPVSTDNIMASSEPLVVSGTAKQNASVTLNFANESVNIQADALGHWKYDPSKIRYIMLRKQIGEVNSNGIFALRELAIFDNSSSPVNIAPGKTVSSNQFTPAELSTLIDGNEATIIEKSFAQGTDVWIQVDLGDWYTLSAIRTAARDANSEQFERLIGTDIFVSANDMSSMTQAQQNASGLVNSKVVSGYGYHFSFVNPVATVGADLTATSTISAQQTVSAVTSQVSTDVTVFSLTSTTPSDNGYLQNLSANLLLSFNQATVQGTGFIQLYNAANTLIETFDVATSSQVTGWGTHTLTINPSNNLAASTGYYIKIDATAIKDTAGNAYAGIADASTFNFSTPATDGSFSGGPTYTGASNSKLGWAVSGAGDVNGDGFDDFLVGAHGSASVYLVYGNSSGSALNLAGSIALDKGIKISGGGELGISSSAVGDVNGDGYDDMLIGGKPSSGVAGDPWSGSAIVVYGGPNLQHVALGTNNSIPSGLGFKIIGGFSNYMGSSVSGVGDVNGDGLADLLVGGTGSGHTAVNYVVYGRTSSAQLDLANGTIAAGDGFKINTTAALQVLSGAGDVNGDGLADLIMGSTADWGAFVIYGNATGTPATIVNAGNKTSSIAQSSGFKIVSLSSGNIALGKSVASAGDVNGDGLADVVMGASSINSAYVIYGNSTGNTVNIDSANNIAPSNGYKITGLTGSLYFGFSVSSAGDINGDGLADVVIGSQVSNGVTYVVYGNATGETVTIAANGAIDSAKGFKLKGSSSGVFGYAVSAAGDINGDGLGDLILGSQNDNGAYNIVLGGTQWLTSAVSGSGTLTGTAAAEAMIGSTAADTLSGGGGVDRFFAGMGNDTIVLTASDVTNLAINVAGGPKAYVSGGGGFDTIRLIGGAALDLRAVSNAGAMGVEENSRIEDIERIDLTTDTAANALVLTAKDVKDMAGMNLFRTGSPSADGKTWSNVSGSALSNSTTRHQLLIDGTVDDSVVLAADAGFWTEVGTVTNGSADYTVFENNASMTQVLVRIDVTVTNNDSVAPVVIDLNQDHTLDYSYVALDVNGDGHLDKTAWAGAQDGVLVWDKYADGWVHDNSQYAFAQYTTAHKLGLRATDLQGLAEAFDSDGNGSFNAHDAMYSEFAVWRDADQNGISDAGEVRSLADWGIHSLGLSSDGHLQSPAQGVVEHGRTMAQMTDGTQVWMADAEFFYEAGFSLQEVLQGPALNMSGLDDANNKPLMLSADSWGLSGEEQASYGDSVYVPALHFLTPETPPIL